MDLTDDIWFEVFLHLSLTAIFKFKCVSKVWFSILSSPNFVHRWYQLNYSSLPWALFDFAIDSSPKTKKFKSHFAIAYPDSHSQFINDHQNGFSFNFLNFPIFPNSSNDEESKDIIIRSSSNGLVLCSIELSDQMNLYVCNPLTQKWVQLPQLPTERYGVYGLICNETFWSSLTSTSYKVIHVPWLQAAAKEFKVEVFCSDLGEWNTYDVSCPSEVTCDVNMYDNFLTYNGGFYWFQKKYNEILAFSFNGNTKHGTCGIECRLINLPEQATGVGPNQMRQYIGESEGLICYAIVKDTESSLSVWVLDGEWYLLHKCNEFSDILAQMESRFIGGATTPDLITKIKILGFDPFDKNVVIFRCKNHVWAYNTRTGAYEQLFHPCLPGSDLPSLLRLCFLTFSFKPTPTVIPPVSRRNTSILDGNICELGN